VSEAPFTLPGTLAACLEPTVVAALDAALGPPLALRARGRFEIELEAAGEGTFTLLVDAGAVRAKKGFAKDPLLSFALAKGSFPWLRRVLQAACEGFPKAPALARMLAAGRAPRPGDLDAAVAALGRLKDACLKLEVKGAGSYALARGPVDEATQVLTLTLEASAVDAALGGASLSSIKVDMKGDRGVLASALAALGPLVERLKA